MKAVILVILIGASGCLGSSGGDEQAARADPAYPPSVADAAAPAGDSVELNVQTRAGSLLVQGLAPLETGRLLYDNASLPLRADDAGRAEILFLAPDTPYILEVGQHRLEVRTQELAWNWTSDDPALIQPGWTEPMEPRHCTLGVILRDAHFERLYGVMVGHCAGDVGQTIVLPPSYGGHEIGHVVSRTYNDEWERGRSLLFEIDPDWYADVNPAIYEIGGPTSIGNIDDMEIGHRMCFYGHGYDGEGGPVQEDLRARCGEYAGTEELVVPGYPTFAIKARADGGDSGSAVIDEMGRWQGVLISAIYHDSVMATPACRVLEDAAASGYELGLVPAPYHGFEPAPFNEGSSGAWATYGFGEDGARLCPSIH